MIFKIKCKECGKICLATDDPNNEDLEALEEAGEEPCDHILKKGAEFEVIK